MIPRFILIVAALVTFGAFAEALNRTAQAQTQTSDPAQNAAGEGQNGRYAMTPAPNGFLRLDTRTGAVALCTLREGQVACAPSADERGALEAEIARLARENATLRERLAEYGQRGPGARLRDALPSQQEMNRALEHAETFMRRMMRIMREEAPKGQPL